MTERSITYLGIDWGESKIGLAIAESSAGLASPYSVVKTLADVLAVLIKEKVDEIVLGKPIKLTGHGEMLASYSRFASELEKQSRLPIHLVDERLTSRLAQKLPGGKKVKAKEDAIAAMLILETYLEQRHG